MLVPHTQGAALTVLAVHCGRHWLVLAPSAGLLSQYTEVPTQRTAVLLAGCPAVGAPHVQPGAAPAAVMAPVVINAAHGVVAQLGLLQTAVDAIVHWPVPHAQSVAVVGMSGLLLVVPVVGHVNRHLAAASLKAVGAPAVPDWQTWPLRQAAALVPVPHAQPLALPERAMLTAHGGRHWPDTQTWPTAQVLKVVIPAALVNEQGQGAAS